MVAILNEVNAESSKSYGLHFKQRARAINLLSKYRLGISLSYYRAKIYLNICKTDGYRYFCAFSGQ